MTTKQFTQAEIEAFVGRERRLHSLVGVNADHALDIITYLQERERVLTEALKPFADHLYGINGDIPDTTHMDGQGLSITAGDIRRAFSVLNPQVKP